ncbi:MAG TPA: nucleotidyltransferase domain-containing protein [Bacteroidetes bacterium]|nr:nucleotidyltransferase domain-containing protein [Bacteroidota bacterium]
MINLEPDCLETVKRILAEHVPEFDVLAFGSRLNPSVKEFSDLDLVVMTNQPLPIRRRARLMEALSESDLPIKVDVVDWATTDENFRAIIRQRMEIVQKGAKKTAI